MNAYDFDETILNGDSEDYFFKYVLDTIDDIDKDIIKRYINRSQNNEIIDTLLLEISYKEVLDHIDNLDIFLDDFWNKHEQYIKTWYLKQKRCDDVIISATPSFLLKPIINRLGIKTLIATELNLKTGKLIGNICYRDEKVNRFKELFNDLIPDKFYSDSNSDIYMARIAKKAYKVIDDKIIDWKL